ncbi:hypothetical protein G6L08_22795 [Agrobacterium rhizogenes]|nr:hypothetical protein [Rhizobium rhizogenes]
MINAYAFRLKPSYVDKVKELLTENQIAIGWSKAHQVLEAQLSKADFQTILSEHYPDIVKRKRIGHDVNHLWRFVREVNDSDIVVVPHGEDVHFLQVTSGPKYRSDKVDDDTAIRRDIIPLLGGKPLARSALSPSLQKVLSFRETSKDLSSSLDEVLDIIGLKDEDSNLPLTAVEDPMETYTAIQPWWDAFKAETSPVTKRDLFWIEGLNIWLDIGGSTKDGNYRHENSLGNMLANGTRSNPIVLVNPSNNERAGRWQGLIAKSTAGETWLLHSGEMKLTHKVVQLRDNSLDGQLDQRRVRFQDGTIRSYFPVAQLDVSNLEIIYQTKRFMDVCQQVRVLHEENNRELYDALRNASLLEESIGYSLIPAQQAKLIDRRHAKVWSALRHQLEEKSFTLSNERIGLLGPDLFTVGQEPSYLFEIKTGRNASDYLKGIGQLIVYEKILAKTYQKFLVLPEGLRPFLASFLKDLGIEIIEYTGDDPHFAFKWPHHF